MRRAGFVVLEVMLAVAIFAMGVIALGACVGNGLTAEVIRSEDRRARLALLNRMAEIEAGSVKVEKASTEELKGMFAGMTLRQSFKPWVRTNENKENLEGIDQILLEVVWNSGDQPQKKSLSFYVMRTN